MKSYKILHSNIRNMVLLKRTIFHTSYLRQGVQNYSPNNLEKRCLVWTGKYKSVEEVPALVSPETMERCRNKMRIRIANIMMLLTVIGCGIMIYSGKSAAKRGETVQKANLEWHKKYNEQSDREASK